MKLAQGLHITLTYAMALCLISASCNGDKSYYPAVQLTFVTAQTDSNKQLTDITTDGGRTYAVTADRSNTPYPAGSKLRMVANYTLESTSGKDTVALVYASAAAIASEPQATNKFQDGIKTDPAQVLSIWQGRNYLNIVLNILSQTQKHSFAFVEQSVTTDANGRRKVSLLLYHNSNNDIQAYTQRAYLSIPLSRYAGADNKGALITFSLYTDDGSLKSYAIDYIPQ